MAEGMGDGDEGRWEFPLDSRWWMCLPGSTDARLVLSQRRRLAGGSREGPACKVHESREKGNR